MIATSGRLITGVEVIPPIGPRLEIVMVEPDSSSRAALPVRAASARRTISDASCHTLSDLGVADDRHHQAVGSLGRHAHVDARRGG